MALRGLVHGDRQRRRAHRCLRDRHNRPGGAGVGDAEVHRPAGEFRALGGAGPNHVVVVALGRDGDQEATVRRGDRARRVRGCRPVLHVVHRERRRRPVGEQGRGAVGRREGDHNIGGGSRGNRGPRDRRAHPASRRRASVEGGRHPADRHPRDVGADDAVHRADGDHDHATRGRRPDGHGGERMRGGAATRADESAGRVGQQRLGRRERRDSGSRSRAVARCVPRPQCDVRVGRPWRQVCNGEDIPGGHDHRPRGRAHAQVERHLVAGHCHVVSCQGGRRDEHVVLPGCAQSQSGCPNWRGRIGNGGGDRDARPDRLGACHVSHLVAAGVGGACALAGHSERRGSLPRAEGARAGVEGVRSCVQPAPGVRGARHGEGERRLAHIGCGEGACRGCRRVGHCVGAIHPRRVHPHIRVGHGRVELDALQVVPSLVAPDDEVGGCAG